MICRFRAMCKSVKLQDAAYADLRFAAPLRFAHPAGGRAKNF